MVHYLGSEPPRFPPSLKARLKHLFRAVESGALAGDGQFSNECERIIEAKCRTSRAMLTPSCTSALEMAALVLNISPGDEVIMPSYTFCSTANAFVLRGAVPVFVDISRDDLNIDPDCIRAAISPKTKAIVPVHYAGNACAMGSILEIAREHNLAVVEDAAQALMGTYHDVPLGGIGQIGCISFHATKDISSGHGGAILVNDPRLVDRAEIIRDRGTNRASFLSGEISRYSWVDLGSSFYMSELCSAYLLWQLECAHAIAAQRQNACDVYREGLADLQHKGAIRFPIPRSGAVGNGHFFYFMTNNAETRTKLLSCLVARGIAASFHYTPLHLSSAGERYCRIGGSLATTEEISDRIVRLPVRTDMSSSELQMVVEAVHDFFR